ncbi:MAG: hypothetical protein AAF570_13955, partial [Bacteroidota bacterium]
RKWVILGNVTIVVLLLVLLEFSCFLMLGMPRRFSKEFKVPDLKPDHPAAHMGIVPHASTVMRKHKVVNGDTVFKVGYTIDEFNRRVTPGYDSARSKYCLWFGCSVGFGFGLEDNQTLAYHFQEKTDQFNSYNYCYSGWGTNHMLARLEYHDFEQEVVEKDGMAIYVLVGAHVRRNIGDMNIYNLWGHTMPYYDYAENGKIKRFGNFHTGRPKTNWLYRLLFRSYTLKYFKILVPISLSTAHLELTADMVVRARDVYREKMGNDNFYVLFHPSTWVELTKENKDELVELLEARGIRFFEHSETIELDKPHRLKGDPHPNERTYKEVADLLMRDLKLSRP